MLFALILWLFWSIEKAATQSVSHCMYVRIFLAILENIELIKADSSAMFLGTNFAFPITWNSAQSNISSHIYSFIGYKLFRRYVDLSFSSEIVNVTSTNAVFIFSPKSTSKFLKIMFAVMLFSTCED